MSNNIVKIFDQSKTPADFAKSYLSYLSELLSRLDTNAIQSFINEIEDARQTGNTVFIIGNGGSAATSSHMANDIGLDVMKKSGTSKPYRFMALTDNIPVMTAIGNDDGYDNLFLMQLKIHYRKGDKVIAISASGNSPNLITAINWVKERGGKILGLTGFDGGKLKQICDVVIHAQTPKGEYGPVEDIHMIMDHLIGNFLLGRALKEEGKQMPIRP